MNTHIRLSSLLAERRVEILQRWTQRIAREHTDKELSRGELWDHLPLFFDEVLAALRTEEGQSAGVMAAEGTTASAAHGTQRLRVGFDLAEVVREYEILTECILDEVEALGGSVSIRAFRRVQALLNAGRAEAVFAYIQRRDTEMAREHSRHVAFIAHELRNPLMTAFTAATLLRKAARSEDDYALTLLTRNLGALRELIDQVLLADRLSGELQLVRESLDLRPMLDEVIADARLAAEPRHIELILHCPDTLPITGDRRLLRSAIGNLLGNAVKFTHEGHAITVRAARHEGRITIEVEDGCGGLPAGNASELFEPFVQRGENRTGFGLGLAIVKQALEAHRGTVSVRNLPGRGCVFSLELPESAHT
ncbi:MAG TPA: sensor histidine kinase [Steroidobacteraceae bacterium]|nr:sensor histidine kinase [Steroidobacteraceae bacterium]